MDIIGMYNEVEWLRAFIYVYNVRYRRQDVNIDCNLLEPHMKNLYKTGMVDVEYWEKTGIDFANIYKHMEEIEKAVEREDFVYIKDKLNYEIWYFVKRASDILFDKDAAVLENYFWRANKKALESYYPMVLGQMEKSGEKEGNIGCRSYGLRGKVVYRENENGEDDLYSAYNPMEVGGYIAEIFNLMKYKQIYVWGYSGGFEFGHIINTMELGSMNIKIYVIDLKEFRQILSKTLRSALISCQSIEWKFCDKVEELFGDFDFEKKEESYIYIDKCYGKGFVDLKEFICKNSLYSNLKYN